MLSLVSKGLNPVGVNRTSIDRKAAVALPFSIKGQVRLSPIVNSPVCVVGGAYGDWVVPTLKFSGAPYQRHRESFDRVGRRQIFSPRQSRGSDRVDPIRPLIWKSRSAPKKTRPSCSFWPTARPPLFPVLETKEVAFVPKKLGLLLVPGHRDRQWLNPEKDQTKWQPIFWPGLSRFEGRRRDQGGPSPGDVVIPSLQPHFEFHVDEDVQLFMSGTYPSFLVSTPRISQSKMVGHDHYIIYKIIASWSLAGGLLVDSSCCWICISTLPRDP